MGTPDFALPSLRALAEAGHGIAAVYSQPPRPAGRGHREQPSPVHAYAKEQGWEVRTPASLKDAGEQAAFAALDLDAAVVVVYGLILPKAVLDAPRLGCLNVHASLLPRWRGAAPIQRAILAGDTETGITIMQVEEELDAGPILTQERMPITASTTAEDMHDTLAELGARMIAVALDDLDARRLDAKPQAGGDATYAAKLARCEGRLDWRKPAVELERAIRAFTPWPGATFVTGGERIKALAAEVADDGAGAEPGTLLAGGFTVACGTGALRLTRVQRPGKAATEGAACLRGLRLEPGTRLEQGTRQEPGA